MTSRRSARLSVRSRSSSSARTLLAAAEYSSLPGGCSEPRCGPCAQELAHFSLPLLYNPHRKGAVVYFPRIAPPRSRLEPVIRQIESKTGAQSAENGRLAFRSFAVVVQELIAKECGVRGMPPLDFFQGGNVPLPIVVQWDGTGYGNQHFNTIVARNPWSRRSHSAQHLCVFGLGNCNDDRSGTRRLLGPNLSVVNL